MTIGMPDDIDFLNPKPMRIHHLAHAAGGIAVSLALALIIAMASVSTPTSAAAPTFSAGSPTPSSGGVLLTADVTTVASTALNAGSLGGTNFQAAPGFDGMNTSLLMRDVFMINATTGWLVGDGGLIRKTTDGGVRWALQTSGSSANLKGIHFADANTGYAVGGSAVLKTTNGGSTWSALTVAMPAGASSPAWNEVYFTDTSTGFIVGSTTSNNNASGAVFKTTDGGLNWVRVDSLGGLTVVDTNGAPINASTKTFDAHQDIVFVSASTGYVATTLITTSSQTPAQDALLKTTNAGGTWTYYLGPRAAGATANRGYNDLAVIDANTVYAVGVGGVMDKTTNGGTTISALTSGTSETFRAVDCASSTTCWASHENDGSGAVLETTNGSTWATENVGTTSVFDGLSVVPASSLIVVVGTTRIVRSADGSSTWTSRVIGDDDYRGVHVVSATEAYVVGENGKILKSTDNGGTWTEQTSGTTNQFDAVHCASSGNCWAVGASATMRKTANGGTTWSTVTGPGGETSRFTEVFMVDANTVWIGTEDLELLKTTDGGTTWTQDNSLLNAGTFVEDIVFLASDTNTGYLASRGDVHKTTNGGTSWSSLGLGGTQPFGMAVVDASTVYVSHGSGGLRKTTNGGTSWSTQTSGVTNNLAGITCIDASTCWAVYPAANGDDLVGYLFTADGGSTWTEQTIASSGGKEFMGVAGVSSSTMLIVGGSSAIYRPTYRVKLQTASGNMSTGAATGDDLCTNVTYNSTTLTVTCAHSALTAGTWYILTLVGDDGGTNVGVQASDNTELVTSATKAFRTAFASDASAIDIPSTSIASLYQEGYFLIPGGETTAALSQVTADVQIRQSVSVPSGSARVTLPDGVVLQKQGGGTFNLTQITLADATTTVTNVLGAVGSAIQYGLANATLTASANVEVRLPVDSSYNGATLNVFRDSDGNFSGMNPEAPDFTCTVSLGFCAVNATSFSYFVVILSGSPASGGDSTPPPPPTELKALGDARRGVTFTWKDPTGTLAEDLDRVQVYLRLGPARLLIGVAPPGAQKFTYRGSFLIAGGVYLINVATMDRAGNRSPFTEELFFLPPSFLLFDDTEPPLPPENVKAVGDAEVVTIIWDDPPIPGEDTPGIVAVDDLAGIEVYRVIGGKSERRGQIDPEVEIFVDKDDRLVPGTCYTYALVAMDLAGNASNVVTTLVPIGDTDCGITQTITEETPAEIQSLPSPTNPSASSTNGQVRLAWADPTGTGVTALHILLFEGEDQKLRGTVEIGKQSFTDAGTDLLIGRSYRYAVQAVGEQERISDVATVGIIIRGADLPTQARADVPEGVVDFLADAPCELSLGERSFLAAAFRKSQGRPPTRAAADLDFLCGLRIDPRNPEADVTAAHPELRNTNAEELALKNFVNFFGRPPSKGFADEDLPEHVADRDWAAVKHMAYHFLVATTARDMRTERACIRMFTGKQIELYKRNPAIGVYEKTLKPAGVSPAFGDEEDRAFIDACSYSGARFIGVETQRTARTVAEPLPTGTGGE